MSNPRWFNEEMVKICKSCGNKFYPTQWKTKRRIYRESKVRYSSKQFCNLICSAKYLSNRPPEENYFYNKKLIPWNAGKRKDWHVKQQSGYIRVIHKDGSIDYDHRIAVNCPKGMVVHHIDKNKSNNNIDNLMILTPSQNTKLHLKERWK